jgi:hypothetical protein
MYKIYYSDLVLSVHFKDSVHVIEHCKITLIVISNITL